MVQNQRMDVPELLEAASLLVPTEIATENDITINDVWDYLAHDEWEVALGLLEELADVHPLPLEFWEGLATAAGQMRLERSAAWCQWRCYESRNGIVRADLTLRPASTRADGRLRSPEPVFCGRCGASEIEHQPVRKPSTSHACGSSSPPPWGPASVPRCDLPPSTPLSGDTSSPAKRSRCTKTGPSVARLSSWKSRGLRPRPPHKSCRPWLLPLAQRGWLQPPCLNHPA